MEKLTDKQMKDRALDIYWQASNILETGTSRYGWRVYKDGQIRIDSYLWRDKDANIYAHTEIYVIEPIFLFFSTKTLVCDISSSAIAHIMNEYHSGQWEEYLSELSKTIKNKRFAPLP